MTFDKNDRDAIEAALADTDPSNPIAQALAEGVSRLSANLQNLAHHNVTVLDQLLLYRPETAFDDIVIRLTLGAISEELGYPIEVHWVDRETRYL